MGLKEHKAWCHAMEQVSAIGDIISATKHIQQVSQGKHFDKDKDVYMAVLYRSVGLLDDDNRSWLINILSQRVKEINYRKL